MRALNKSYLSHLAHNRHKCLTYGYFSDIASWFVYPSEYAQE